MAEARSWRCAEADLRRKRRWWILVRWMASRRNMVGMTGRRVAPAAQATRRSSRQVAGLGVARGIAKITGSAVTITAQVAASVSATTKVVMRWKDRAWARFWFLEVSNLRRRLLMVMSQTVLR